MEEPLRSCSSVTSCIKGWSSWNELKVLGEMFCPVTMSNAEASCSLGLSYTEGGIEKYRHLQLPYIRSSVTTLYVHTSMYVIIYCFHENCHLLIYWLHLSTAYTELT